MATSKLQRKRPPAPDPLPEPEPVVEDTTSTRYVGDLAVIKTEQFPSPLSSPTRTIYYTGLQILTLQDNTTVIGCGDCVEFTGTRGEVRKHRTDKHGAGANGANKRRSAVEVLSPAVAAMTLTQLLEIANDFGQYSEMFATLQDNHDTWRDRCLQAEAKLRKLTVALERAGFAPAED